jgi:hypothetical protein
MKEVKIETTSIDQRQQLITPKGMDVIITDTPIEPNCTSRNICEVQNGGINGSEDILF